MLTGSGGFLKEKTGFYKNNQITTYMLTGSEGFIRDKTGFYTKKITKVVHIFECKHIV